MSGVTCHLQLSNCKSYGAENLREGSPPPTCHVASFMCHVSPVMCYVSCVTCHVSLISIYFLDKVVKLVDGGSDILRVDFFARSKL